MRRLALIAALILLAAPQARAAVNGVSADHSKGVVLLGSPAGAANCKAATTGAIRYNSTTPRIEFCNGAVWASVGSAGSAALSALTAATAANTINSAANAQVWDWNSLSTGNGLTLGSTSVTTGSILYLSSNGTAAGTNQTGLWITLTGANAGSNKTTYGANISNTHSANGSTNVGLYATATGGATANYAAIFDQGNVGIGTTSPAFPLQIGSNSYAANARMGFGNGNGTQERIWSIGSIYGGATVTEPNYGFTIRDETRGTDALAIDWNTHDVALGTDYPAVDGTYQTLTLDGASGGEIFFNKAGTTYANLWADDGILGLGTVGQPIGLYSNGGGVATDGYITVDQAALDTGIEGVTGFYHGLILGGGGSGEAIGSSRSGAKPPAFGIDFYTDYLKRMSIENNGWVGIGTDTPDDDLTVVDSSGTSGEVDIDGLYIGVGGGSSYWWDTNDEPFLLGLNNNFVLSVDDAGNTTITGWVNAGQYTAAAGFIDEIYPSSDRHEFEYADAGGGSWYTESEADTNALFGISTQVGTGLRVDPVLGGGDPWGPSIDVLVATGTESMVQSIYSSNSCFLCGAGNDAFVWGEKSYDPSPSSNYFENFYPLMVLTNGGGLGVGTTQPDDNLTIEDPNGSGDGAEMDISGLYIGRYNGGEGYISDNVDEPLTIYTNNGTGYLTINDLGSVGIDTNPDTDFTVGDTGNDGTSEIDNAYGLYLGSDNVGDAWLAANDSTGISFQVGGVEIMDLFSGGLDIDQGEFEVNAGDINVDDGNLYVPVGEIFGQYGSGHGDVLQIGDDSVLADINLANGAELHGMTDGTVASLKLGSGGGVISGKSGNIGIGTTTPAQALEVNGQIKVDTFASASATTVCQKSNVLSTCSSSIRYKENVKSAPFGLKEIMAMRPVTFKWKGRDENDLGFIAEEMEKVNPLFVTYARGQIEGVKYPQLTAVLAKAVQELKTGDDKEAAEIKELKAENDNLRSDMNELRAEITILKAAKH